jgi:hypothetical protein
VFRARQLEQQSPRVADVLDDGHAFGCEFVHSAHNRVSNPIRRHPQRHVGGVTAAHRDLWAPVISRLRQRSLLRGFRQSASSPQKVRKTSANSHILLTVETGISAGQRLTLTLVNASHLCGPTSDGSKNAAMNTLGYK